MSDLWIDEVLQFWFEELKPNDWFMKVDRVDALIRQRFERIYEHVSRIEIMELTTPQACVAAVIVLDQFPRNMFRNSARAFETDAKALAISQHAISRGFDEQVSVQERVFLYMPWQHSENTAIQARSVELYTHLGDATVLGYARQHQDIVDRFGRFPHRNRTLGRASTPEEEAFMKTHPGF